MLNAVVLSVIVLEIALSDVTFEDSTFLLVTDGDSDLPKLLVVVASLIVFAIDESILSDPVDDIVKLSMFGLENGILSYVDFAESTLVLEERRVMSVVISIVVVCVVVVEGNIGSTEKMDLTKFMINSLRYLWF